MLNPIRSLACVLLASSLAAAANYYVDAAKGSDSNGGDSPAAAWKSLGKMKAKAYQAGDTVHFMSGSTFSEALALDRSGASGKPIVYRASGTGQAPEFKGGGIKIGASWVVLEGVKVSGVRGEGIRINKGAMFNVVTGCEISESGAGLWVAGTDNLITKCNIHDLKMVTNTPGGDDDNGAVGIWMNASRVEISYNSFVNCKAQSYDYKFDGGAVEWWADAPMTGSYIHHNYATGCEGFIEAGGRGALVSKARVAYNVSVNNGLFALLNGAGQYAIGLDQIEIDHNTIVQTEPHNGWGANHSIYFFSTGTKSVKLRNNLFYLTGWSVTDNGTIAHTNNFYRLQGKGTLGFTLGPTEKTGDPLFTDPLIGKFELRPGSPALDMGQDLGFTMDFLGRPARVGKVPDAGAFEFQGEGVAIRKGRASAAAVANAGGGGGAGRGRAFGMRFAPRASGASFDAKGIRGPRQ